jgi:hypothetical protein
MRETAAGNINFRWNNGSIKNVTLPALPVLLQFSTYVGRANIADETVTLFGNLKSPSAEFEVSGTATFGKELRLKLANSTSLLSLSGTLQNPKMQIQALSPLTAKDSASNPVNANSSKAKN